MATRTVTYNDFQKMLRLAKPGSGVTAENLARSLQLNGHNLGEGLEQYKLGAAKPTKDTVHDVAIQKEQGFFSRMKDSIMSTPERLQRGFGSKDVREGRTETSKGFDLADLPGDIADIIGPAIPAATSIIGGTVGAGVAIPTGLGAIGAGMVGGGLGAGVGEVGRSSIGNLLNVEERFGGEKKTPLQDVKQVGVESVKGAAGELIGGQLIARPIAAVGKKLLAPFARYFDIDLARIAARRGVELPASSTVDNPILQLTEQVTGKGIFGGNLKLIVKDAEEKLASQADDIVKGFKGSDDLTLAGKGIEEGLQSYKSAWQSIKNKIYTAASKVIPKSNRPLTENTKTALETVLTKQDLSLVKQGADSPLRDIWKSLQTRGLKQPSLESLMATSDNLGEILKGSVDVQITGSKAMLAKVKAAIDDDIMAHLAKYAPEAYEAAIRADSFYAQGIESLNSTLGKTINTLADEPSKIAARAIRPKSPEQASRVIEMVISTEGGADRVANIQSSFVRRIIDESTKNGTKALQGETLGNVLNRYGDETLDAVLGQDARIALREIAKLSSGLGRARNIAEGSQTAFLLKTQAIVAAIFTGNVPLAAQIAGGDVLLSKVFQSQIGRKWLTEGLTSPTVLQKFGQFIGTPAAKVGGRETGEFIGESLPNTSSE